MECPDCRSALKQERLLELRWVGCGAKFWFRGGEIIREGEYEAIKPGRSTETHKPPATPASPPEPPPVAQAGEHARGMRAGVYCPACRAELVHEQLSALVCSSCGDRYWQRGGEVVPAGETEAIETPGTELPAACARFRKDDR